MDLDIGAGLKLDKNQIPENLQYLIPIVARWGFSSLQNQDKFIAAMKKKRPEEVIDFNETIDNARELISEWGDQASCTNKHMSQMTDEDWNHPYWAFLRTLKVSELTYDYDNDPEVLAARKRLAHQIRIENFASDTSKADQAFRKSDYSAYVSILEPYEDLLSPTQQKKMLIARKRC